METAVLLGMIAEITMKAKMLRQKLRSNPKKVKEIHKSLDLLEFEMFVCMLEFDKLMAK